MDIKLNSAEQLLFSLLKSALHGTPNDYVNRNSVREQDWAACYKLAVKHGVRILSWDGIQLLPDKLHPPRVMKLSWYLSAQKYEKTYEKYCKAIYKLASFYEKNGIKTVQLKGVGLSTYYPIPSHREGGDIDIYTYSADRSKMSDEEANRLADRLIENNGIKVNTKGPKHSNFVYNRIVIENHRVFLNMDFNPISRQVNDLLAELMQPREVSLCDGKYTISIPSPEFNAIFLSFHAAQHYCSNLSVHHLFDWACMLKSHGLRLSPKITDRKFLSFIYALTNLSNELLGTDIRVPYERKMVKEVYEQIMHPHFSGKPPKDKIQNVIYRTLRFFHHHYKNSKIFNAPFWKIFWNAIVSRLPSTGQSRHRN